MQIGFFLGEAEQTLWAYFGCSHQLWVFGGDPRQPPAAGSVDSWSSAPTASLCKNAAAVPLFLLSQTWLCTHALCQEE